MEQKKQSLQEYNSKQNLLAWSERIRACRESGMSVREWCSANEIALSTYYSQQRKVFEAAKTAAEAKSPAAEFAEIQLQGHEPPQSNIPIATIRIGEAEADIYSGADEASIRVICRILKSC